MLWGFVVGIVTFIAIITGKPNNYTPQPNYPPTPKPKPQPRPKPVTYNVPNDWIGREIYGYKVKKIIGKGGTSYVLLGEKDNVNYALKIYKIDESTQMSQTITTKLSSNVTDILREHKTTRDI